MVGVDYEMIGSSLGCTNQRGRTRDGECGKDSKEDCLDRNIRDVAAQNLARGQSRNKNIAHEKAQQP